MKLHSPEFQQRLRRRVKQAIRESAALKKEHRQARKFRKHIRVPWLWRIALSLVLGGLVFRIVATTKHPAAGLAVIAVWMFGWIFIQAAGLWTLLHADMHITALRPLPVEEADILKWQLQKFFRKAAFSLLDPVAGLGAIAFYLSFPPLKWLALLPIAVLSWVVLLALAALCVVHLRRAWYQIIASLVTVFGFFSFFLFRLVDQVLIAFLDHFASDLTFFLPTGWPVLLFQLLVPDTGWLALLLVLPSVLLSWSLFHSFKQFRGGFGYVEQTLPVATDLLAVPGAESAAFVRPTKYAENHLGLTEIEEMVQTRQFLVPVPWEQRGWLERLLWRWLDRREKALAEFAFPGGYAITTPWRKILRNLLVAFVLALLTGLASPSSKPWILGIGLLITGIQALAQMLGSGAAFRPLFCSGVNIPIYASLGIGYRELSRLLIKCSVVQLPCFVALVMAWSVVVASLNELPWQVGAEFGIKLGVLIFAARWILLLFAFSKFSNDSSTFRLRTFVLIVVVVSLGSVFMGLSAAGFLVPDPLLGWILWALTMPAAYFLFRVYGWFHNANRFDLMSLPR